uniref:Acetyltransferase n=2 Tax=Klebsiella/Raoultella group TaxID=2890311 RepID=A0A0P0YRQ9_9ENTR|nr:acetyltransferase [Klebsiella sp. 7730]
MTMNKVANEHYDWVDATKGLGILLVIAGHTFSGYLYNAIYLFHMPMFFFIAGYLHRTENIAIFFKRKVSRLIKPYVFYLILFTLIILLKYYLDGALTLNCILHLLAKSLFGGVKLTGWEGVFWFVTVFMISQQLLNILLNYFSFRCCVFISMGLVIFAYMDSFYLSLKTPLGISLALFTTPIMLIGYAFRKENIVIPFLILLSLSILSMIVTFFYPNYMMLDIKHTEYGLFIIGFCVALVLSLLVIELCKNSLLEFDFLIFAGNYSLFIMFIHQFLKDVIIERLFSNVLAVYFGTVLLCFFLSFVIYLIKKKNILSKEVLQWVIG